MNAFQKLTLALALLSLTTTACKKHTTPPNTTEGVSSTLSAPEQSPDKPEVQEDAVAATSAEFSAEEREALLLALGCAQGSITEKGCKECPVYDDAWGGEHVDPMGEITIALTPGVWSDAKSPQALAMFEGCNPTSFGALSSTEIVHLVKDPAEGWMPASYFTAGDVNNVQSLDSPGKPSRTFIQINSGRMGVYSTDYVALDWQNLESIEGLDMAGQHFLLSTTGGMGCADNWEIFHKVTPTFKDLNEDGWIDVSFAVTTTAGPYMGELDACLDGDAYEAPLTPERTESTSEHEYLYHGGEQGFREHKGKASLVPIPSGYESLL